MTGLLFDLDGTLLNTLEDLKDATNYALRHFGYPEKSLEEIRRAVGNGAANQIRKSLPEGTDEDTVQEILAFYKDYYASHCQIKTAPYDGVLAAVENLKKKYPVAIVSNKPDPAVKTLCAQYFGDTYALGESAACPRKPAPDMVYQGMKAIDARNCIYIGDSEVDILTARNAGVPCLSVLWGFRDREQLEAGGGSRFCSRPEELPEVIGQIMGEMKNGK